ncbi:MAG TPA: hypothetical protein VME40_01795 [Caulobacteraceae bacterium]|nr:hypothetical protein [Caulobacteraceae bacterium]
MSSIGDRTRHGPPGRSVGGANLSQLPGFRLFYALGGALAFGIVCGLAHAPFWVVVVGGLAAALGALWLERDALAGAEVRRRPNFPLLISSAFVFLAIVGVGVVSLGYFLDEWAIFKFAHR